jgi:hypothetical protein
MVGQNFIDKFDYVASFVDFVKHMQKSESRIGNPPQISFDEVLVLNIKKWF